MFVVIESLAIGIGLSTAEATSEIVNHLEFALKTMLSGSDGLEMVLAEPTKSDEF